MPKKEPFDSPKSGWMAQDGTFFETQYMEHIAISREIYHHLYPKENIIQNDADER